ncbi:MAG: hypothetical protein IT168_13305 [Bryobacterales bacterium]|nr:hypothetical protein [Bryobacterales bacterium]
MAQALVLLVSLVLLANGLYAAISPGGWIRCRWSLSGTMTAADAENPWMRLQIRAMGFLFSLAAITFVAGVLNLPIANFLADILNMLFFASVLIGSLAVVIWPEQNLTSTLRRRLPENRGQRRLSLLFMRLLGLAFFVLIVTVLIRRHG